MQGDPGQTENWALKLAKYSDKRNLVQSGSSLLDKLRNRSKLKLDQDYRYIYSSSSFIIHP